MPFYLMNINESMQSISLKDSTNFAQSFLEIRRFVVNFDSKIFKHSIFILCYI